MSAHAESALYRDAAPNPAGYRDLAPAALHAALGQVHVVDVREADELVGELGHIAGVEHAPLATVAARASAWPPDRDLVLVCRSGARSGRAAQALAQAGFTRVMNLAGGMIAYRAAGFPATGAR